MDWWKDYGEIILYKLVQQQKGEFEESSAAYHQFPN